LREEREHRKQLIDRLRYNREKSTKTIKDAHCSRFVDKLAAVVRARTKWSRRSGFAKWKLLAGMARQEAVIRRDRIKINVQGDRVRAERNDAEQTNADLKQSRLQLAACLLFQKWKSKNDLQKRAEDELRMVAEARDLRDELNGVKNHLAKLNRVDEETFHAARKRGNIILGDLTSIEHALNEALLR
jgi:hypothetical protein